MRGVEIRRSSSEPRDIIGRKAVRQGTRREASRGSQTIEARAEDGLGRGLFRGGVACQAAEIAAIEPGWNDGLPIVMLSCRIARFAKGGGAQAW